jgi:hypothetical protein
METITIHLELTDDEAAALAQFLKRAGHGIYSQCAIDEREAYDMLFAGEKLRRALVEQGYAPR